MIIWITGLSGAGKSTIARQLVHSLKDRGIATVLLDGDEVREVVQDPTIGHDRESRLTNAYRICRLAKLLERQGLTVVVATMSLFHEIHVWNRSEFEDYREILVQVDPDILRQRDARSLYSRHSRGEVQNVVGLDIQVELPLSPDLVLDNNFETQAFTTFADRILALLD